MDHRLNLRIPIALPVQLLTSQCTIHGRTLDLSFEGARVRLSTVVPLPQGTVSLCFEPGTLGINVPAMVVRCDGDDLGIMFGRYDGPADIYLTNRLSEALDGYARPFR